LQKLHNNELLRGHRVLKPMTVDLTAQNLVGTLFAHAFPPLADGQGFGLGVRLSIDSQKVKGRGVGALAWSEAYGTDAWSDPELGLTGVVLVQQACKQE
jgi:CubicO group peptidase (beta-lactamase class C family)